MTTTVGVTPRARGMCRPRRWWASQCWVVRSGFDSTWRASSVDVHCARWLPRRLAVRRARAAILDSYPTYGHLARFVRVERWELRSKRPGVRSYWGWRVVFDKSEIFRAIYGCKPYGGL